MNITKEYIDMCRKAREIQELWERKAGDWIVTPEGIKVISDKVIQIKDRLQVTIRYALPKRMILTPPILDSNVENALSLGIDYVDFEMYPQKYFCWIPRQDQLQGLITTKDYCKYDTPSKLRIDTLISGFSQFCNSLPESGKAEDFPYTIEMLWLMWVMKLKFNKRWSGVCWI